MSAALHPCVGRTSDAILFALEHTQPEIPAGLGHTTVLACRPEDSEAVAQRVNGHKAEYERLQKALREANLQAAPAFCSNLPALRSMAVGPQARNARGEFDPFRKLLYPLTSFGERTPAASSRLMTRLSSSLFCYSVPYGLRRRAERAKPWQRRSGARCWAAVTRWRDCASARAATGSSGPRRPPPPASSAPGSS